MQNAVRNQKNIQLINRSHCVIILKVRGVFLRAIKHANHPWLTEPRGANLAPMAAWAKSSAAGGRQISTITDDIRILGFIDCQ